MWSWRRFSAGTWLIFMILMTSISSLGGGLQVDDPAPTPTDPGARAERPLNMADPPVILGLVLLVGLMLPDIRRIRFGPDGAEIVPRYTVRDGEDVPGEAQRMDPKESTFRASLNPQQPEEPPS